MIPTALLIAGVIGFVVWQGVAQARERQERLASPAPSQLPPSQPAPPRMQHLPALNPPPPAASPYAPRSPYAPPLPSSPMPPSGAPAVAPVTSWISGMVIPGAPTCPTCSAIAQWIPDRGAFGCERCQKML